MRVKSNIWQDMIDFLKVIAFIEEKTTHIVEKTPMKEKDFPQVMFCPKTGLKSEELVKMEVAEDFLVPHMMPYQSNFNLTDIDQIWENGTYQRNEFNVLWTVEDGNYQLLIF